MYTKEELCEKITELYPEIGECGRELNVHYDDDKNAWVVHLTRGPNALDHYLEVPDADTCMEGRQCFSLGLEIAQLRHNVENEQF